MQHFTKEIPIRQIAPTKDEPAISQTFRIRKIETILNGKNLNQDLHRHNFFFVLALKKGQGSHVIDFDSYEVSNKSIFIMRPGQVHELSLKKNSTGYLMEFNLEFYHRSERGTTQMMRRATRTNRCKMDGRSFDKLNGIPNYISEEYHQHKEGYQEIIRAQLDIFFIEFTRNQSAQKPSAPNTLTYEQERLEAFVQLIETHVTVKKQVSEYANMLNVSPYQLGAITKSILGKTPSELINEYIVLEAKRYLFASTDQVNQIAWHLGYEDPSYFIRFFKKHTGHSPEAFRSNSR